MLLLLNFVPCFSSALHLSYPVVSFILVIVLGSFLLSFTSNTSSVFSLQFYSLPILFYSVIHHFILKFQKFYFLFFTFTLCFFPSELPKYCTAAADIYRSPSLCHIQPEWHTTCMQDMWCWVVTAIMHYSNGILQDWLQETDLAFQKY